MAASRLSPDFPATFFHHAEPLCTESQSIICSIARGMLTNPHQPSNKLALQTLREKGWIVHQVLEGNPIQLTAFNVLRALRLTTHDAMLQWSYNEEAFNAYLPSIFPEEPNPQLNFTVNLISFLILSPVLTKELESFDLIDVVHEIDKIDLILPKKYADALFFKSILDEGTLEALKTLAGTWKLTTITPILENILRNAAIEDQRKVLSELIRHINLIKSILRSGPPLTPEGIAFGFKHIQIETKPPESSPLWDYLYGTSSPLPELKMRRPRVGSYIAPPSPRPFSPPPFPTACVPAI